MDPPTASGECSSDSKSSSSAPRLGLEHPQRFGKANTDTVMAREMRKKRITFGHRHVDDPDTAPDETSSPAAEGILRRGRFAPKRPSMSSSYNPSSFPATPKRRRYHSLMVISAFGILSSGVAVAAYSLLGLGGQVLSSLTGRVPSRKLRGGSNGGGFDQMAAWLRAETAGMDPEERKRVSLRLCVCDIYMYSFHLLTRYSVPSLLHSAPRRGQIRMAPLRHRKDVRYPMQDTHR